MSISPASLTREMSAVDQIRQMLGEDDPQLLLNTIEGETHALELVDALIEEVLADELLAAKANDRVKRLETRAARRRALLLSILQDKLRMVSLQRPLATLSVSYTTAHAVITDQNKLPDEYMRTVVDASALGKALRSGERIDGAELSNTRPMLTLRAS